MPSSIQTDTDADTAYRAAVERYAPMLTTFCNRRLSSADADDAVQAVFLILWRSSSAPAAGPELAAWLIGVARNVVRNQQRSLRRRRGAEARAGAECRTASTPRLEASDELLDDELARLPNTEREAIEAYYLAGHTYAEISAATGRPLSTVAARVQRGLDRLRRRLGRAGVLIGLAALGERLQAAAAEVPASATQLQRLKERVRQPSTSAAPALVLGTAALRIGGLVERSLLARCVAGLAALGLSIGVCMFLTAEEPVKKVPETAAVPAADNPAPDPAADQIVLLRLPDPQRTWRRLLDSPYAPLLSDGLRERIATQIDGLGPAWGAHSSHSPFTAERRQRTFDRQRQIYATGPVGPSLKALHTIEVKVGTQTEVSEDKTPQADVSIVIEDEPIIDTRSQPAPDSLRPDAIAEIRLARADAAPAVQDFLRQQIMKLDGPATALPMQVNEDRGTLAIDYRDSTLRLRSDSPSTPDDLQWIRQRAAPVDADSDIEFEVLHQPLDPAAYAAAGGALGEIVQITVGSLRFSQRGLSLQLRADTGPQPVWMQDMLDQDAARLAADAFARVPADAFLAVAIANQRQDQAKVQGMLDFGDFLQQQLGVDFNVALLISAVAEVLNRGDAPLLAYGTPGAFLPNLTAIVRCDPAAAATFLDLLRDLLSSGGAQQHNPTLQIGEDIAAMLGPLFVQLGLRGDRLILTSDPRGLDAVASEPGGFDTHPAVAEALQAQGDEVNTLILVRDRATFEAIDPLLSLLPQTAGAPLQAFADGLPERVSYLSMTQQQNGGMITIAEGVLPIVALLPLISPISGLELPLDAN